MNIVPSSMTRSVGRTLLQAKKNSPAVFFTAGVIGAVGATVMACKATLDLHFILDEIKEEVEACKFDHVNKINNPEFDAETNEKAMQKDLALIYARGAMKISKLYGPAVVVGGVSIAALTGSHIALSRRNTALAAAYAAVAKGFEEYRLRVREELGEEKERHIYHGAKYCEIEGEDGKKTKALVVNSGKTSPYARFFDEGNPNWQKNADLNRYFVQCQETFANQKLRANGHLFLNEVYDMFQMERSTEGCVVGWLWKTDNGDGYIDLGVFDAVNSDFLNGLERSILLDFNVDGVIYDKI